MIQGVVFVLLLQFGPNSALEVTGNGNPTIGGIWANLQNAYNLLLPPSERVTFKFNITNPTLAITALINKTAYYDYGIIDSGTISAADTLINPDYKTFPVVGMAMIPQINLKEILPLQSVMLSRETLAGIFMGDITNWQDPQIVATNLNLNKSSCPFFTGTVSPFYPCLPNKTIEVIYRSDVQPVNFLMESIINAFSNQSYVQRFGPLSNAWPSKLNSTNKPNFKAVTGTLLPNAQGLVDKYSIAYSGYNFVIRDPQIQFAKIINKYGYPIGPDPDSVSRTLAFLKLGDDLKTNYVIDPDDPAAFPWVSFLQILVSTKPPTDRCHEIRALYRFFNWVLTTVAANSTIQLGGFAPLPQQFGTKILAALATIQCAGTPETAASILAVTPIVQRDAVHTFLLIFTTIMLILVLILTGGHLYAFQTSRVNFVYSMIFVCGALITLSAPYAWLVIPNVSTVCQARVWLTSVGLSVLLGTMFSRTWQLREIYLLQKKNFEEIRRNTTVRSSLIKLSVTLTIVVAINLIILIIWAVTDPYRASFNIVDPLLLTGRWSCVSTNLSTWLELQCAFLLCTIAFGVYVIYYTWSFQKKSLIEETRWVLFALYNILLNLTATVPIVAISSMTEENLAILITVSLLFSGGGIIFAFLLPRLLKALSAGHDDSTHDSKQKMLKQSHNEPSSDHRKETYVPSSPKTEVHSSSMTIDVLKRDDQVELTPVKPHTSPSLHAEETSLADIKDDPVSQQGVSSDDLTTSQRPLDASQRPLLNQTTQQGGDQGGEISPSQEGHQNEAQPDHSIGGWRVYFPPGGSEKKDLSSSMNWSPNPLSAPPLDPSNPIMEEL